MMADILEIELARIPESIVVLEHRIVDILKNLIDNVPVISSATIQVLEIRILSR